MIENRNVTIIAVEDRTARLEEQLLKVWESSVKATHRFLSEDEMADIKKYVPRALKEIPCLVIAEDENQIPVGFMGIAGQHLEMLFIAAEERGKGIGKELLAYGIDRYSVRDLAVNEQNPLQKAFMRTWDSVLIGGRSATNREIRIRFYICGWMDSFSYTHRRLTKRFGELFWPERTVLCSIRTNPGCLLIITSSLS